MFRMWGKILKENRMIQDLVIEDDSMKNRTQKVYDALDGLVYQFELSRPIWLDSNIEDFKRFSKTRFGKDNFIEEISFDYLEIQMIEEDPW